MERCKEIQQTFLEVGTSLRRDTRQWEEVSKDEEKSTLNRSEGGMLQVENVRSAPQVVLAWTKTSLPAEQIVVVYFVMQAHSAEIEG